MDARQYNRRLREEAVRRLNSRQREECFRALDKLTTLYGALKYLDNPEREACLKAGKAVNYQGLPIRFADYIQMLRETHELAGVFEQTRSDVDYCAWKIQSLTGEDITQPRAVQPQPQQPVQYSPPAGGQVTVPVSPQVLAQEPPQELPQESVQEPGNVWETILDERIEEVREPKSIPTGGEQGRPVGAPDVKTFIYPSAMVQGGGGAAQAPEPLPEPVPEQVPEPVQEPPEDIVAEAGGVQKGTGKAPAVVSVLTVKDANKRINLNSTCFHIQSEDGSIRIGNSRSGFAPLGEKTMAEYISNDMDMDGLRKWFQDRDVQWYDGKPIEGKEEDSPVTYRPAQDFEIKKFKDVMGLGESGKGK